MDYRYGSHTVYKIEYHFVWATKYRYEMLQGEIGLRVRDLVRQSCQAFEIEILRGVVSKDHVHILVSAPPHLHKSGLKDPKRVDRLLIAVALAYIWMVYLGEYALKQGWEKIIHRTDRCDLSLFHLRKTAP